MLLRSRSQASSPLGIRSVVRHSAILDGFVSSTVTSVLASIRILRQFTPKLRVDFNHTIDLPSPVISKLGKLLDSHSHSKRCFVDVEVSHVVDASRQLVLLDQVHVVIVVQLVLDVKCHVDLFGASRMQGCRTSH
jgi:hypothetical protein